jgi:hypothetical protein
MLKLDVACESKLTTPLRRSFANCTANDPSHRGLLSWCRGIWSFSRERKSGSEHPFDSTNIPPIPYLIINLQSKPIPIHQAYKALQLTYERCKLVSELISTVPHMPGKYSLGAVFFGQTGRPSAARQKGRLLCHCSASMWNMQSGSLPPRMPSWVSNTQLLQSYRPKTRMRR